MPHNLSPFNFQFSPPSARHYHPTLSIWLSVDPMSDKYPSMSPYTYCANNPVKLVDPDGSFDKESRATRFRNRAVRRFGKDRVGEVSIQAGTSHNPNYIFTIYDNAGDKERTWGKSSSSNESGIVICAPQGNSISSAKEYRKYAGTGVNLKIRFSIGAQAGYKIGKKSSASVNLNSVDLVWAETGTNGSSWGHVDDYGLTTNRRGVSIGPFFYNYEKAPYMEASHSWGVGVNGKNFTSANAEVSNQKTAAISIGIAIVFGIHLDCNFKW